MRARTSRTCSGRSANSLAKWGAVSLPLPRSAADEINEDLNDLIAAGSPVAKAAVPVEPSREMSLGTAADLFRSSPAEIPDTPVSRDESEIAALRRLAEPLDTHASRSAGRAEPATPRPAAVTIRLRRLLDCLPPRARVPLAAAVALLMGWLAGASLTGSRAHQTAPAVATEERPAEKVSERSSELTAKAAALEEQLQQALAERAAAQRERQQAVVQLKLFEAQAQYWKAVDTGRDRARTSRATQGRGELPRGGGTDSPAGTADLRRAIGPRAGNVATEPRPGAGPVG